MHQYNPQKVTAVWTSIAGAVDILEGAAADSFLEITTDTARWSREMDREGNGVRNKNNNRGGMARSTITSKSPLNKTLSDIANADDEAENVVGTIVVKDLNGDTLVTLFDAFLEDQPAPSYGATSGNRVWVWQYGKRVQTLTGQDVVGA